MPAGRYGRESGRGVPTSCHCRTRALCPASGGAERATTHHGDAGRAAESTPLVALAITITRSYFDLCSRQKCIRSFFLPYGTILHPICAALAATVPSRYF